MLFSKMSIFFSVSEGNFLEILHNDIIKLGIALKRLIFQHFFNELLFFWFELQFKFF